MKVYYDTEFLEDGRTIDLISIAMVAEDGRELYRVIDDEGTIARALGIQWLRENVLPSLPIRFWMDAGGEWNWVYDQDHQDWHLIWPAAKVAEDVQAFIQATPDADLWAWYGAYDHVALAQLFGRMIDLPSGFPMWTNDLKQECARLGDPRMPEQPTGEHNALADARHVKAVAEYLRAVAEYLRAVADA